MRQVLIQQAHSHPEYVVTRRLRGEQTQHGEQEEDRIRTDGYERTLIARTFGDSAGTTRLEAVIGGWKAELRWP